MVGVVAVVAASVGLVVNAGDQEIQAQRAQAEQARLVREGVERVKARAVAQEQAAALKALEQPLPASGELQRYAANWRFQSPGGLPGLKVTAPPGASYAIKLADWTTHAPVLSVFVRAGEVIELSVPFGTYVVTMASGSTWYGDTVRFGPRTGYYRVDSPMEFKVQGDHSWVMSLS